MRTPNNAVFTTIVLDPHGRVATQHIEAASVEQARLIASTAGHTVLQCAPREAARSRANLFGGLRLTSVAGIDTVSFSQDLATLMEAGVTVKEAVDALARREESANRRQLLARLNDTMAEGLSLSAALEQSKAFPALLVATVAASEQTGDLSTGLSRYAKHQQSLRAVRDRVIGACIYPMLLLTVGSFVVLMLLGVVVPRFSRLLDSQNRELPMLSKLLMAWGQFADAHPTVPFVLLAAFVGAIALAVSQSRNPDKRKKWLTKIPGVAKVVREFQHLQMYRTTAILTSRGITVHKALVFSENLLSPADRARLRSGLALMREGQAISAALLAAGLSDEIATSMLNVAERSGALPEMLDRIADFYERSLQRNIDIVSRLIEPILMIVFGIVIGGIVVLMYLPIFDLASSIS
jgi:general secretion pathway protein F